MAHIAQVVMNRGGAKSLNAVDAGDGPGDYKKILKKLGEGAGDEETLLDDLCAAINVQASRRAAAAASKERTARSR